MQKHVPNHVRHLPYSNFISYIYLMAQHINTKARVRHAHLCDGDGRLYRAKREEPQVALQNNKDKSET